MHFRAGLVLGLRFRCASALMRNRVYTLMNDKTVFILTLILRGVSERRFLGSIINVGKIEIFIYFVKNIGG